MDRPHRVVPRALLVPLACLALTAAAHAQPQPEYATPCVANARLDSGLQTRHTEGCAIDPTGADVDSFVFSALAGENVRLTVSSTGAVAPTLNLTAPGGGNAGIASCAMGPCSARLDVLLTISGDYTVTVADGTGSATGPYVLQLDRLDPRYCAPMPVQDEVLSDTLAPITDVDILRVEGVDGDTIRIAVTSSGDADVRVELLAPDGAALRDESCTGPCTAIVDEALGESGTFRVLISDAGADETGTYDVTLSCLAGACAGGRTVDALRFEADPTVVRWDPVGDLTATYEVSRGVLQDLRSGGNLAAAGFACLDEPIPATQIADPELPAALGGFVYLTRARGGDGTEGSPDNRWGPAQVCGRTLEACGSEPGACDMTLPIGPGGIVSMDNNCDGTTEVDQYFDITDPGLCSGAISGPAYPGPEVIYSVDLGAGNDIVATLAPNASSDLALFMIAECGVGTSCVTFDDKVGLGVGEEIRPGPLPEGTYFVYVDSYYSSGPEGCGDYTLNFGGALGAAELVSFSVD